MADASFYHLVPVDVRTELRDQLEKWAVARRLAEAVLVLVDDATAKLEDVLARVDVELN